MFRWRYARREQRVDQLAIDRWAVHQHRIGREEPARRSRIRVVGGEGRSERIGEHTRAEELVKEGEGRPLEEEAKAASDRGASLGVHCITETYARREIVAVNGVLVGVRKPRVVNLAEGNDLQVIADAEAERKTRSQFPSVLHEA